MAGDWGSACGPACGYCGACTSGPKVIGYCRRCEGPYFSYENNLSGLCDPCLDAEHEQTRIAQGKKR